MTVTLVTGADKGPGYETARGLIPAARRSPRPASRYSSEPPPHAR
jgi:hypothetical protein